ncbi:MAG: bifunctional 5,10-methylenetetrahydrofolate dehydrogenase/5,10-methenyltetrahydrofolate cyclohydrolase [Elusimicrobia bacterium]|nr:bifunctional 5,10-methylenetetrahydrofolate dehydrogenase/5,10-methenyltetrahydrofolate cyclohydrolase [Elusimicrobiota bacterium]
MKAKLLDGRAVADSIRIGLGPAVAAVRAARGTPPLLAIVTAASNSDRSSQSYQQAKVKACAQAGLMARCHSAGPEAREIIELLGRLGADPSVDGIMVEQPLPAALDPVRIFSAVAPAKDVEGVNPSNYGRFFLAKNAAEIAACGAFPPCTVAAIIVLLGESGIAACGREAVVVGRSEIVGRPAAHYLCALDATVTLCHSRTADLPGHVRRADIVVACAGRAGLVRGEWIKPGAVVIDAGMNRVGGAWAGDVEFAAAAERAAWITPVPGGVGPVTTAVVLANTVQAAQRVISKGNLEKA